MENSTVQSHATFSPTHIRDTEVERSPTLVCYFQGTRGQGLSGQAAAARAAYHASIQKITVSMR